MHVLRLQYLPDTYYAAAPDGSQPMSRHGSEAPRLGISCLDACLHTRGKSGCEHANSYCSARLTLMLTPTLTSTLTEPGSLPCPVLPGQPPIACTNCPADEDTASGPQLSHRETVDLHIDTAHQHAIPTGWASQLKLVPADGAQPSTPSPARVSLRWSSAYYLPVSQSSQSTLPILPPTPDMRAPGCWWWCARVVSAVGPLFPGNGSGRRRAENLINRFHTHLLPRIITTD